MTPKSKQTFKWIGIGIATLGGSGTIFAILFFALNAWIANAVHANIAIELNKVPTIETITNQHSTINDGISDNVTDIHDLKISQDEFRLLFIEYLQRESER